MAETLTIPSLGEVDPEALQDEQKYSEEWIQKKRMKIGWT